MGINGCVRGSGWEVDACRGRRDACRGGGARAGGFRGGRGGVTPLEFAFVVKDLSLSLSRSLSRSKNGL
jgi:hypothetical protein